MMRNRQRAESRRGGIGVKVIRLVELTEKDRQLIALLPVLDERDEIELHVHRSSGELQTVHLPPRAAGMIGALLDGLGHQERIVLLSKRPKFANRSDLT